MARRTQAILVLAALLGLAGCLGSRPAEPPPSDSLPSDPDHPWPVTVDGSMVFEPRVVAPAVGFAADLYEPTLDVSASGTLYLAGHVLGAVSTGTPAYVSGDDGRTWRPLPLAGPVAAPSPAQGSAPPPGDEGFIVAGDDGRAWMVDVTLATFPIYGWCGDGGDLCYANPNAYDRTSSATSCHPAAVNDRPWAAYAKGKLLLVNNPGGPMQIGVLDVPPDLPVGAGAATWNLCASPDVGTPGVPALRADGVFAVPKVVANKRLQVVLGNVGDIQQVQAIDVFNVTSAFAGGGNFGHAAFDEDGALYLAAFNSTTDPTATDPLVSAVAGRIKVAASADDGASFAVRTFDVGPPVRFLFLDGNPRGPGALLTWSTKGDTLGTAPTQVLPSEQADDWFAAHLHLRDGVPALENVTYVGRTWGSHGDVMGSAAGPDGRAYVASMDASADPAQYLLSTPLLVWVQVDGPTLPPG